MTLRLLRAEFPEPPTDRPHTRLRDRLHDALRGLKLGIRRQSSFFLHFFSATLIVVAATVLQCELVEWCILLGCIGFVMVAELFKGGLEAMLNGLDPTTRERSAAALNIASGAVLLACVTATSVGLLVLTKRLWLTHWGS